MTTAPKAPLIEPLESRTLFAVGLPGTPVLTVNVPFFSEKSYVSGQKTPTLRVPVNVANDGTGTAPGVGDILLFASTDQTLSPDDAQLTPRAVPRALGIPAGRNRTFQIPVTSLPVNLNGAYFILASVTTRAGLSGSAASTSTINVSPATVDLSAEIAHVPTNARVNGFLPVRLLVGNAGNVTAKGRLEISFFASPNPDGTNPTELGSTTRPILIPSGKARTLVFNVKLTVGVTTGNQFIVATVDPSNTFNDPTLADNTAVSLTPVSIV